VQSAWFAAQKAWCEGGLNQPFFSKTEERKDKSSSPTILQGQVFLKGTGFIFLFQVHDEFWTFSRETFSCSFLPIEKPAFVQGSGVANS